MAGYQGYEQTGIFPVMAEANRVFLTAGKSSEYDSWVAELELLDEEDNYEAGGKIYQSNEFDTQEELIGYLNSLARNFDYAYINKNLSRLNLEYVADL